MEHEMIDWLDADGNIIGVIDKAVAHKEGQWHRSVHVWIVNDKNQILLAHRCKYKNFFANCWDCSFAGHIGQGESSLDSAIREGFEEIGLKLNEKDFEFLFTFKDRLKWKDKISNEYVDVYLIHKNIDIKTLNFQEDEVDDAKWIDIDDFFNQVLFLRGDYLFHNNQEYVLLKKELEKRVLV